MTRTQTLARLLANAVKKILDSESVVQLRGQKIRKSVQEKSLYDWRLKGKGSDELDVIATLENLRDTRTLEDISSQSWQHTRAQTFALYLLTLQLDELLGTLRLQSKEKNSVRADRAEADPGRRTVDLGNRRCMPSTSVQTSPPVVTDVACLDAHCGGTCGLPVWDSPNVVDANTRAIRRAVHSVNRTGNSY